MFNVLSFIGEKFNNSNIRWGVGASILLNQYNLIDKPNDIDIFVDIKDIKKIDEILRYVGEKKVFKNTSTYSTKYFYEYVVNGIDIDVMADFAVNHSNGIFEYTFDDKSISDFKIINGVKIPFTSLEDWYIIYQLISNREQKVKMIEDYLLTNGVKNHILLERALQKNLPIKIKNNIEKIVSFKR